MRSCCFGCARAGADKNDPTCGKCYRRLALLDRLDYMAQARSRAAEPYGISAGITRYHDQPEIRIKGVIPIWAALKNLNF